MRVFINDQALEIFSGATVRDAVNMFERLMGAEKTVDTGEIHDHWGNSVSPAGELSEDDRLYLKVRTKE